MSTRLADQVRQRLRDEMKARGISQRELGDLINRNQPFVTKRLTGKVEMTLDELEAFCIGLSLRPVEAVRDRGLEFVADMTPAEHRMFTQFRHAPPEVREMITFLLRNIKPAGPEHPPRKK